MFVRYAVLLLEEVASLRAKRNKIVGILKGAVEKCILDLPGLCSAISGARYSIIMTMHHLTHEYLDICSRSAIC